MRSSPNPEDSLEQLSSAASIPRSPRRQPSQARSRLIGGHGADPSLAKRRRRQPEQQKRPQEVKRQNGRSSDWTSGQGSDREERGARDREERHGDGDPDDATGVR